MQKLLELVDIKSHCVLLKHQLIIPKNETYDYNTFISQKNVFELFARKAKRAPNFQTRAYTLLLGIRKIILRSCYAIQYRFSSYKKITLTKAVNVRFLWRVYVLRLKNFRLPNLKEHSHIFYNALKIAFLSRVSRPWVSFSSSSRVRRYVGRYFEKSGCLSRA